MLRRLSQLARSFIWEGAAEKAGGKVQNALGGAKDAIRGAVKR